MTNVVNLKLASKAKRRVLVVEDHLDSVHAMATLLRMSGHDVEFAIDGFAALDVARHFRPDVLLLDIGLPNLERDKIARQLRWEPGLEKTRFVAMTGLPTATVRQRALNAGCEAVYAKPLDSAHLEALTAGS